MDETINITFMRHGRSRADDENVFEGRYDSPLTEAGRAQARARGEGLKAGQVHYDLIVASTLQRAHETARIIGEILEVPVETDPDWMEFNNGPLAGVPIEEGKRRFPRPTFRNPYEAFWETGESEWELYSRAARAVAKVIRRGPGRYLVVGHGGILNQALRTIVGAQPPINSAGTWFRFEDLGYVHTVYYPGLHQWFFLEFQPGYFYEGTDR